MSLTAPMAMTRVSSANAAMIGSIADSGLFESETSTISTFGGAPAARWSTASRVPPCFTCTPGKCDSQTVATIPCVSASLMKATQSAWAADPNVGSDDSMTEPRRRLVAALMTGAPDYWVEVVVTRNGTVSVEFDVG